MTGAGPTLAPVLFQPRKRTMAKLQILLIGGSGFVSGTLARTALAAGHDV